METNDQEKKQYTCDDPFLYFFHFSPNNVLELIALSHPVYILSNKSTIYKKEAPSMKEGNKIII